MAVKKKILRYFEDLKKKALLLRMRRSQTFLSQIKNHQQKVFDDLRDEYFCIYQKLRKYDFIEFTTPYWVKNNTQLERKFLPSPSFIFLNDPIITSTMFVDTGGKWMRKELSFLEKRFNRNTLRTLLEEDYVGRPLLLNSKYLTSHNSIHHLYSITRFLDRTGCDLDNVTMIIEWGGGYGNFAKIFKRLTSTEFTYIVVDTPLLSCVQWLYLSSILGKQNVHILQDSSDFIHLGAINLVPICFLNRLDVDADLFISTWALSESSLFSQDYVISRKWFNAKHILLAYQKNCNEFPMAERIGDLAKTCGATTENIDFLPGHQYSFL